MDRFEIDTPADEAIICRCERVTAGEIRELVAKGVTDENEIKALTRTGMGACQSKTYVSCLFKHILFLFVSLFFFSPFSIFHTDSCHNMMGRLFWEEGVNYNENVTKRTVCGLISTCKVERNLVDLMQVPALVFDDTSRSDPCMWRPLSVPSTSSNSVSTSRMYIS